MDPLKYWKGHAGKWPRLYEVAKYALTVSATSIRSESTWSHAGQIESVRRTTLTTKTLDMLLFLQQNVQEKDCMKLTMQEYKKYSRLAFKRRATRLATQALM